MEIPLTSRLRPKVHAAHFIPMSLLDLKRTQSRSVININFGSLYPIMPTSSPKLSHLTTSNCISIMGL